MKNAVRYKTFEQISFADMLVYSKLPDHPFWSNVETKIDFSFADQLCAVLYSGRGQHPYAPSLKLKVHLVQGYYVLSDRQTEEKIIGDLFIKRFLGLPVDFFGFDHSTIGLDRNRMGATMFQACHLYILAQMYSLGLWGDKDDKWIIDSFPANTGVVMLGAHRLIQQAMIRILQHLKRSHRVLYKLAHESLLLDALANRLNSESSTNERLLAFSKLVAEAYALLSWFETENISMLFSNWDNKKAQQKSLELQAVLKQILMENSRPVDPGDGANTVSEPKHEAESEFDPGINSDLERGTETALDRRIVAEDPPTASTPPETAAGDPATAVQFEKIPRKERPSHRIISAYDPEARFGAKSRFVMIKGFKVQNLCTTCSVILNTRVIPASEPDREAMVDMIHVIQSFFGITPDTVLGDTAYGYGKQRSELAALGMNVVAPVVTRNPTSLYEISRFTYNREKDVYICPNGKETIRKHHSSHLEGSQYHFGKENCSGCPFRSECTTSQKSGRTIFHSDYFDICEAAQAYNESDAGKEDHKLRYLVERKNNELKNDCGLGDPNTRGTEPLQIKSTLAGIIVNLKLTVRRLIAPNPGFVRRTIQA